MNTAKIQFENWSKLKLRMGPSPKIGGYTAKSLFDNLLCSEGKVFNKTRGI